MGIWTVVNYRSVIWEISAVSILVGIRYLNGD